MSPSAIFLILIVSGCGAVAAVLLIRLRSKFQNLSQSHSALEQAHEETEKRLRLAGEANARFQPLINLEAEQHKMRTTLETERSRIRGDIERLQQQRTQSERGAEEQKQRSQGELSALALRIDGLRKEMAIVEEAADLRSFGFYKPHFTYETSTQFVTQIERVRDEQKRMIQSKTAAIAHTEWQVNNSVAEGRKQIDQTLRLLLRAFNGECDAAIAKVRYNNVTVMETRITKSWEALNRLSLVQNCDISPVYRDLKLKELRLTHEYQEKQQEEKEEQRRIREQMREEEVAVRELEKARQEADREEQRYAEALVKARAEAQTTVGAAHAKLVYKIEELQRLLEEARTNKERAMARAQMTRSGHVYVISNVGSFGENVFKIGMTRRLDPMDRVRELGDASVPFIFDVHAILFSDDAPGLENALHKAFHHRRLNAINERKEFFHVSIDEIADVVRKSHGSIEITKVAEAAEYRKTLAFRNQNGGTGTVMPAPPASAMSAPTSGSQTFAVSSRTQAAVPAASAPTVVPGGYDLGLSSGTGPSPGKHKRCPKCQRETLLQTMQCAGCGHAFRTRFDADGNPIPDKTRV